MPAFAIVIRGILHSHIPLWNSCKHISLHLRLILNAVLSFNLIILQNSDSREHYICIVTQTFPAPPLALVNVTVVPSTVLAVILWAVQGTGGHPIIDFTAQYKPADNSSETWLPISPNHIPHNCVRNFPFPALTAAVTTFFICEQRQIDVYKLEPNTSYAFRVWATNKLGSGEIVEVVGTTRPIYTEQGAYAAGIGKCERCACVLRFSRDVFSLCVRTNKSRDNRTSKTFPGRC